MGAGGGGSMSGDSLGSPSNAKRTEGKIIKNTAKIKLQ